jgi:hypothetical protein
MIGLALATVLAAPVAASTIVYNGSFETGVPGNKKSSAGTTFESLPGGAKWGVWKALNGWTTVNGPGIEVQTSGTIGPLAAQHGSYYVELDSTGNSTMEQQVKLAKGSYLLSFWYSPRTGNTASDQIDYSVGDLLKGSVNAFNALLGKPVAGWQKIVAPFSVGGKSAGKSGGDSNGMQEFALRFGAGGPTSDTRGGLMDSVEIVKLPAEVPLPATGVLLLAGLGVLGARHLRRSAKP